MRLSSYTPPPSNTPTPTPTPTHTASKGHTVIHSCVWSHKYLSLPGPDLWTPSPARLYLRSPDLLASARPRQRPRHEQLTAPPNSPGQAEAGAGQHKINYLQMNLRARINEIHINLSRIETAGLAGAVSSVGWVAGFGWWGFGGSVGGLNPEGGGGWGH